MIGRISRNVFVIAFAALWLVPIYLMIVNAFVPFYERTGDWEAMAWWVHDHLPYHDMEFFPKMAAFNLQWREEPERRISSFIPPRRGLLTRSGMDNWSGRHDPAYATMLQDIG